MQSLSSQGELELLTVQALIQQHKKASAGLANGSVGRTPALQTDNLSLIHGTKVEGENGLEKFVLLPLYRCSSSIADKHTCAHMHKYIFQKLIKNKIF